MSGYYKVKERAKKYDGIRCCFQVKDAEGYKEINKQNFKRLKEALSNVGVSVDVKDGELYMWLDSSTYTSQSNRGVGRRSKCGIVHYRQGSYGNAIAMYSDVVWLSQGKTDKDVAKEIDMSYSSFRRHKNNPKYQEYRKRIDPDRANDLDYLQSLQGDGVF